MMAPERSPSMDWELATASSTCGWVGLTRIKGVGEILMDGGLSGAANTSTGGHPLNITKRSALPNRFMTTSSAGYRIVIKR